MSAARSLLRAARAIGLSLDIAGDDLVIEADRDPPAALLAELQRHKAELLALLKEDQAERAAIVEYDGGMPREWSQGFARLHPDRPPADVPFTRWRTFVDDVGRFLDGGFAAQAAALGWGPLDLFGCDGARPFARVDQAGLLWLVHGNRLVALTETTAVIETATGARQIYRRKPGEPGRVLAWQFAP